MLFLLTYPLKTPIDGKNSKPAILLRTDNIINFYSFISSDYQDCCICAQSRLLQLSTKSRLAFNMNFHFVRTL